MIRRMEEADREAYLRLTRAFYASEAVLHPVPEAHLIASFDEIVRRGPYLDGYMLVKDGAPVGYATLMRTFTTEAGGMVLWLEELFVLPEHRGGGLGREFLDYLERELSRGFKRVRLEVEPDNDRALKLYGTLKYDILDYVQLYKDR